MAKEIRPVWLLTKRETEVLGLIAEGLGNMAIGARLGISPRTVETHKAHMQMKLGLPDAIALHRYAITKEGALM